MTRTLIATLGLVLLVCPATPVRAADPQLPNVQLNSDNAAGRPVEELTRKSVARDYAKAWRSLAEAMEQNRASVIDNDFVGVAAEKFAAAVSDQARAGLHTRLVDHGHKLDALFYSPEGLSIELRDTAQLERQVLDGDKVIHSEQVTAHYISLMTPTEVRWKVRLLQEVPGQ
ncbi:MAG: hypothetical protein ACXVZZ_06545 [Terriglobales bacterium]